MSTDRRLKAARALAGWTQRQLAERAGMQEIQISRFETGRACPDREAQRRIAAVLGKRTYELFNSAGEDR